LRVTWTNSNRFGQPLGTTQEDPVPLNGIAPQTFVRAFVRRVDTDADVASTLDAIAGVFNAADFLIVTVPGEILDQGGVLGAGGTIAELDHYIILNAAGLSVGVSQQWQTPDFEVFGFGIGFGEEFGGQAEAADPNTGRILDQGAAPLVIVPTPASEIANRLYQLKIKNDPISSGVPGVIGGDEETQWTLKGFDATEQLNYQIGSVLQGADFPTEDEVAAEVFRVIQQAITPIGTLSFTATHDVATNTIDMRGTQGSTMRLEARIQRPPSSGRLLLFTPPQIVEEAFGFASGTRGEFFMDFVQQSVDPITGVTIESQAPTISDAYNTQNIQQAGVTFVALTRSGQALIDQIEVVPFTGVGVSRNTIGFGFFINTPSPTTGAYDEQFSDILAKLQDSPIGNLFEGFVGLLPGGIQTRTGIVIKPVQDLSMRIGFHNGSNITPFQLITQESVMAEKAGPIAQTSAFAYSSDATVFGGPMAEQVLQAIINDEQFSAPVDAPGGSFQVDAAAQVLIDAINASGQPVSAQPEIFDFRNPNRFTVTHDTPGNTATFDAQMWSGLGDFRMEFRIIDE